VPSSKSSDVPQLASAHSADAHSKQTCKALGVSLLTQQIGDRDPRACGKNIRHRLLGLLRQAVQGRIAGYEDVNDGQRLARDPVMRVIVGREGLDRPTASTSQMGRLRDRVARDQARLPVDRKSAEEQGSRQRSNPFGECRLYSFVSDVLLAATAVLGCCRRPLPGAEHRGDAGDGHRIEQRPPGPRVDLVRSAGPGWISRCPTRGLRSATAMGLSTYWTLVTVMISLPSRRTT
jgi:Transposase DDE domain group 1